VKTESRENVCKSEERREKSSAQVYATAEGRIQAGKLFILKYLQTQVIV